MRLSRVALFLVMASLVFGSLAWGQAEEQGSAASGSTASVPRLIRLGGTVRDAAGKPISGTTGVTFTLYGEQTGESAVWQESQTVQLDSQGRYSVLLGVTNEAGLPLEIFSAGEARWLGVRAEGQAEQPRTLFVSVAYALKAADTEMLGGRPASAYVLAGGQNLTAPSANTSGAAGNSASGSGSTTLPLLVSPQTACSSVTSDGTATANQLAKFTTACNIENSTIYESSTNVGIGTTSPGGVLDVNGTVIARGLLTAEVGAVIAPTGTATTSQSYISSPLNIEASAYNTSLLGAATYIYQWAAEPQGNDTSNTGASFNLRYGVTGSVNETGFSIAKNGIVTFASGQTFPGVSGTVTSVATGAGLTGGPITTSGTISIASAGVTNAMLANSSVTVGTASGSGLSGGGSVALGGTLNLAIPSAGVTNAMLANNSVTVKAGTGMSGGGTVALGGTITLTNSSPSLGGTVTSVATGTGLTGGPITTSGTLTLDTTFTDGRYLQLTGGTLTGGLNGTTGTFSGALSAAGALLPTTGTATSSKGYISNPFDLVASSYSSKTTAAVAQDFRWQAEPTGNNTASPAGTLNLLFGANGATPAETGLSVANTGIISFASGQTFPGVGSGTVTSVATGAGLTGGPITSSGTISIPSAGVTNTMLANNSLTVTAGSGLFGGGAVALGGSTTLSIPSAGVTNAMLANNSTTIGTATGSGLSGGGSVALGGTLNLSIPSAGVTNAMLANNSITVTAGSGLSGGGPVALGGTITLTNSAPGLGGTVTSVASGTGLTGGPITGSGTLSLNTTYTNGLYLQLVGGTLSGGLNGTTGTFSGALSAGAGTFSGAVSEAGALLPGTGTATATQGYNSNALDLQASAFNSTSSSAATQDFRWQAEPSGNNSSSPSGTLNLLFGENGTTPAETGLSIANTGIITFATGQTFPGGGGGGGGTVTQVNTGPGLTGGPITTNGTISIPAGGVSNGMLANNAVTVTAGTGLSGGGTVSLGGNVTLAANLSGTPNGMAYFSTPASVTSTAAPTSGQVLIGSTGSAPVLGTLTAGSNISISNGPGEITISATGGGGSPTLPYFVTGGGHTGVTQAATANVTKLWGILLPYDVTTTQVTYDVTTVDKTANDYDIGLYNTAGALVVNLGATAGTTFAPSAGFKTLAWTQGSTSLPAGEYYLAITTNCASSCAKVAAGGTVISFATALSAGASSGGALPASVTAPANAWSSGTQPSVVIQ